MTPEHTPTGQNERRGVHWAGDSLEQQMGNPAIGACALSNIQNHFLFPQIPSLQTTTAYWIYRIGPQHQSLGGMSNERSYLLENLRRQHDRGQRLSHALCNIETRLASAQSKGEARKLRKEAGLLKSKIAESNKQEQLIAMRLNDLHNEDSARLYQTHQPGLLPYPYSPVQPWGQMTLSPVTTMTPVSPLTPLPPGIYHPSPIPPSPLEPPFFLASPFLVYNPVISHEQNFLEGEQQGLYTPGQHDSASPVLADESRRKSVEHKATRIFEDVLSEQGNTGRRWSLADAFSPSPRDKRMSMPGLQTLWRY